MNSFMCDKLDNISKIHMIGIGGISMSGIAMMLKNNGFIVTGSDIAKNDMINALEEAGIEVYIGHDASLVKQADLVVYTAAISSEDIELVEAKNLGKPTYERAPFLGMLIKSYSKPICVAGMHGKTTTTSMIATAFKDIGVNPTVLVGSKLKELDNLNYRLGSNEYFVLEACEYVDSFLNFPPQTAIILNIEEEHLDYFKNLENISKSFSTFILMLPQNGNLIINKDDQNCMKILNSLEPELNKRNISILTYSVTDIEANLFAENIGLNENGCYKFDLYINGNFVLKISLNAPGKHNVLNALATIGSVVANGLDIDLAAKALEEFTGASRRFEYRKTIGNNVNVYDDYAHHPTEIKATLSSAKDKCKNNIIAVFQPHTYSRTKTLLNEFSKAFDNADTIIVADIYAAREKDDGTISSQMLVDMLTSRGKNAIYIPDFNDIATKINSIIEPNDIVLTIGAGTITNLSDLL